MLLPTPILCARPDNLPAVISLMHHSPLHQIKVSQSEGRSFQTIIRPPPTDPNCHSPPDASATHIPSQGRVCPWAPGSQCTRIPIFRVGGVQNGYFLSFKYLVCYFLPETLLCISDHTVSARQHHCIVVKTHFAC